MYTIIVYIYGTVAVCAVYNLRVFVFLVEVRYVLRFLEYEIVYSTVQIRYSTVLLRSIVHT